MVSASAERALVGIILRDQSALEVAISHGIRVDSFADDDARAVYAAILEADFDFRPFDAVSLATTMPQGFALKLVTLEEEAPVGSNPAFYAGEVAAAAWVRDMSARLAREYNAFTKRAAFETVEPLKLALATLVADADRGDHLPNPATVVERSLASLEERVAAVREGRRFGVSSGFRALDRLLGGFLPGAMYVLAARKKVGKTTFAVNLAVNVAEEVPVAYFTVEMRDQEIVDQALVLKTGVEAERYTHGRLTDDEIDRVADAAGAMAKLPFYVREVRDPSAEHLFHDIRRLWRTKGVKFVVVDYAQQFRYVRQRFGSRQQEMTLLTSQMKALATELQISILAIAQLNRSAEDSHEPSSSQIKDSGSFEQDADAVMLLWSEAEGAHIVNVADNRRGSPGRFVLQSDLDRKIFWEGSRGEGRS